MKVRHKAVETLFKVAQWVIFFGLLYATINVFLIVPSGAGPMAQIFGNIGAQVVYATLYLTEAISLAVSAIREDVRLRKNTLFVTYVTLLFTTTLSISTNGLGLGMVDNLIIAGLSAISWLYWKFRADYVDGILFCESHKNE